MEDLLDLLSRFGVLFILYYVIAIFYKHLTIINKPPSNSPRNLIHINISKRNLDNLKDIINYVYANDKSIIVKLIVNDIPVTLNIEKCNEEDE